MKGAICASDASGEPVHTSHEVISAYTHSKGIQRRYDVEPVSPRQVERNMRTLREQDFVTTRSETYYDAWDRKLKTDFTLEITDENIDNLEAVFNEEIEAKTAREAERSEHRRKQNAARQRRFRDSRNALRGESGGEHIAKLTRSFLTKTFLPIIKTGLTPVMMVLSLGLRPPGGKPPRPPKTRGTLPRRLAPWCRSPTRMSSTESWSRVRPAASTGMRQYGASAWPAHSGWASARSGPAPGSG
jgi:hypothetical protein